MIESSQNMKIIQTHKDAADFKERANSELPKGVTPMKRKYNQRQADASKVKLPEIKFTKAKLSLKKLPQLQKKLQFLGTSWLTTWKPLLRASHNFRLLFRL